MEEKYKNLYNNPRLLYKYYPISKDYAIKYKNGNNVGYTFTPNIPKADLEKLYRDSIVDKWRLIVFEGLLFYTSPAFFNDPFDSALPHVPSVVPPIEERQRIINELKKVCKIKREDMDRLLFFDNFDNALLSVLKKTGFPNELQDEIFTNIKVNGEKFREEIAITCFSEINDSKLMWAHYANSYSGFCVEYDFTKTFDAKFQRGIGKVVYSDIRPEEQGFNDKNEYVRAVLATKALCWDYEREWRSINIVPYDLYSNKNYPIVNVKNCITAIYLGCNMQNELKDEILQYYRNTDVKVYDMQLDEKEFKFTFTILNI